MVSETSCSFWIVFYCRFGLAIPTEDNTVFPGDITQSPSSQAGPTLIRIFCTC